MVQHSSGRDFYDDGYESDKDENNIDDNDIDLSPKNFCGRHHEMEMLLDTYRPILATSTRDEQRPTAPLVLLEGRSGSGKSTLVLRVLEELERESQAGELKPLFRLSGKFEEGRQAPYSAIAQAFSEFGSSLEKEDKQMMQSKIKTALGDGLVSILTVVPGLASVVGSQNALYCLNVRSKHAQNRLRYLFLLLVKAISSDDKPIILFLDDLHWMDSASLDLLCSLVRDKTLRNCMIIGAYRPNELDSDHPLAQSVQELKDEGEQVLTIPVENLSLPDVARYVSNALQLEDDCETQALAKAIFNKTRGNALFTRHAIEELHRRNFLVFSRISFRWEWNEKGLEQLESGISDDVQDAILAKVNQLPESLQRALALASYTRSIFDLETLASLLQADGNDISTSDLTSMLEKAVSERFLSHAAGSGSYRFHHDSVQETFRALVPNGPEKTKLKETIGRALFNLATANEDVKRREWMLFVAADHLNSLSVDSTNGAAYIARVNLECGENALSVAAFVPASRYFQNGVDALRKISHHWVECYDLSLRLYRGLTDVTLTLGMHETGQQYANTLLKHATGHSDKAPTHIALIISMGRQDHNTEAFELARDALKSAGLFPTNGHSVRALGQLMSLRRYMQRHSNDAIIDLPLLSDKSILSTFALYNELSLRSVLCGHRMIWLFSLLRQVHLSLQKGLCFYTRLGFAFYGMYQMATGDAAGAARTASLVKRLSGRLNDRRKEGISIYVTTVFIEAWDCSDSYALEQLKAGHKSAMEFGDIDTGFLCWSGMSFYAFVAGYPLDPIERTGNEMKTQMMLYHEENVHNIFDGISFPILALTGRLQQPIDWSNYVDFSLDLNDGSHRYRILHYCVGRLAVAVYFRKFAAAKQIADSMPSLRFEEYGMVSSILFFTGLLSAGMAKESGDRKYRRRLQEITNMARKLVRTKSPKMMNRVRFLETELLVLRGKGVAKIEEAYQTFISNALQESQIHDAALGNEFAAEYFIAQDNDELARGYLTKALELYEKWGASAKVQELRRTRSQYLNANGTVNGNGEVNIPSLQIVS